MKERKASRLDNKALNRSDVSRRGRLVPRMVASPFHHPLHSQIQTFLVARLTRTLFGFTLMPYTCPCCGYFVFGEPPGSFEICGICGWEDDPVQAANPCTSGGANSESLSQAQDNFQSTPTADLDEYAEYGYARDPQWRRLTNIEREIYNRESNRGTTCPNPRLTTVEQYYWNRNVTLEKT